MTALDTDTAATQAQPARPRTALIGLCITQITSWGVLYYAFPVLVGPISADTGWSRAATTAAFSAALLVSALAGVPVGRILDRRGPRAVMTAGSLLGGVCTVAVAAAPNLVVFTLAWIGVGIAMATTFYQPAFAALTRWYGPHRVRALTTVTLAGGLASTVFAPLTAGLAGHLSWRGTYAVLAVVLAAVTVPVHAVCLRQPWPQTDDGPPTAGGKPLSRAQVVRSRQFVLLAAALTLSAFSLYAVVIGLVPLLTARGASPTAAAWALGLGGLGQTLGRTLYTSLAQRTGVRGRTCVLLAAGGGTTALLALVRGPVPLLIALAVIAGTVRGNSTLLQATAVVDRWGPASYGTLNGLLSAPVTVAGALAPWAGALLAGPLGGYPGLFAALAAVSGLAAVLAALAGPSPKAG